MTYDPRNAAIAEPTAQLRRDITLLSDEQKTKLFESGIDDLPESEKPGLTRLFHKPVDNTEHDKLIKNAGDADKAKAADYVALRLPADKQKKISEQVAEMLQKNREEMHAAKDKPVHHTSHAHHAHAGR